MSRLLPNKFKYFYKELKDKEFTLLDIGAGSHSAQKTIKWFPKCKYSGIDLSKDYRNDEKDFELMEAFYEMDLTQLKFDKIPDNHYDVIMMTHIIEHLHNGDKVIEGLLPKLKQGGHIYIEYPGFKSTQLPSMKDCLNYFDDKTHVRIYSVKELMNLLMKNNMQVIKGGTRRSWIHIILLPVNWLYQRIKLGYTPGGIFWDLLGFAEFVYARKK